MPKIIGTFKKYEKAYRIVETPSLDFYLEFSDSVSAMNEPIWQPLSKYPGEPGNVIKDFDFLFWWLIEVLTGKKNG